MNRQGQQAVHSFRYLTGTLGKFLGPGTAVWVQEARDNPQWLYVRAVRWRGGCRSLCENSLIRADNKDRRGGFFTNLLDSEAPTMLSCAQVNWGSPLGEAVNRSQCAVVLPLFNGDDFRSVLVYLCEQMVCDTQDLLSSLSLYVNLFGPYAPDTHVDLCERR